MPGRPRDEGRDPRRVVVLHAGRGGGRRTRAAGEPRSPARDAWKAVALVAFLALAAVGGREAGVPRLPRGAPEPIRAAINVPAGSADCRVARVLDGDTLDLDCPGAGLVRTRLVGFDTPEVFSPGCASEASLGNAATRALQRRIAAAAEMRVEFRGSDHYGRRLASLSLDGQDVARPMIADGLARPYHGGRRRSWCG